MNRTGLIIIACFVVFIGSLAWWFFSTHERVEKEVNTSFSGEAARNQYYAAELFLEKFNMEVESLSSILKMDEMPSTNDVLFIPTKRYDIGADRAAELIEWVKQGGHLIVLARFSKKNNLKSTFLINTKIRKGSITAR